MRYISLFSGIEAASVGWHDLDWEPVVFADFEDFPSAVLKHHYPTVPNLGDVMEVNWNEYKGKAELVVGGSPCQSFSVAGQRLGMDDPRGNLALHYLRIVREVQPRWFLFENVPGLLSSDGGRDFATFLGEVAQLGYGFAYRVLDAQHFGVPQRRRRLFVVGCADGDWRSAAAVLFERESLCRDSKTSKEAGQDLAAAFGTGIGGESGEGRRRIASPTLTAYNLDSRSPQSEEQQRIVNAVLESHAFTQNQQEMAFDWKNIRSTRPSGENTDPLTVEGELAVNQTKGIIHCADV